MANTLHPLEQSLFDLAGVRRRLLRYFLQDNMLDSEEQAILHGFDQERNDISAYRKRQAANDKDGEALDTARPLLEDAREDVDEALAVLEALADVQCPS